MPVQDKALVHGGLECGACLSALAWGWSSVLQLLLLLWQGLAAGLHAVGKLL